MLSSPFRDYAAIFGGQLRQERVVWPCFCLLCVSRSASPVRPGVAAESREGETRGCAEAREAPIEVSDLMFSIKTCPDDCALRWARDRLLLRRRLRDPDVRAGSRRCKLSGFPYQGIRRPLDQSR